MGEAPPEAHHQHHGHKGFWRHHSFSQEESAADPPEATGDEDWEKYDASEHSWQDYIPDEFKPGANASDWSWDEFKKNFTPPAWWNETQKIKNPFKGWHPPSFHPFKRSSSKGHDGEEARWERRGSATFAMVLSCLYLAGLVALTSFHAAFG